jgi:hypothetical protein
MQVLVLGSEANRKPSRAVLCSDSFRLIFDLHHAGELLYQIARHGHDRSGIKCIS